MTSAQAKADVVMKLKNRFSEDAAEKGGVTCVLTPRESKKKTMLLLMDANSKASSERRTKVAQFSLRRS